MFLPNHIMHRYLPLNYTNCINIEAEPKHYLTRILIGQLEKKNIRKYLGTLKKPGIIYLFETIIRKIWFNFKVSSITKNVSKNITFFSRCINVKNHNYNYR